MAYADYNFYYGCFFGDVLKEESCEKWLGRASDAIDHLTGRKLVNAFPTNQADAIAVKKAVCAVAEVLYMVDLQQKAVAAQESADGTLHGVVKTISSGRESITYSSGEVSSAYAAAAADYAVQTRLLRETAEAYLANVPDANGVNLLYAGVC